MYSFKFLSSIYNHVSVVISEANVECLSGSNSKQVANWVSKNTVRLLPHVLCKPTHFFFHSFIATMFYSLQTTFSSAMKDWAKNYHVGVPPRSHLQGQTRDNSNTRFCTLKRNTYTCALIKYLSYINIYVASYLV